MCKVNLRTAYLLKYLPLDGPANSIEEVAEEGIDEKSNSDLAEKIFP